VTAPRVIGASGLYQRDVRLRRRRVQGGADLPRRLGQPVPVLWAQGRRVNAR
jgi:hypothetical protein